MIASLAALAALSGACGSDGESGSGVAAGGEGGSSGTTPGSGANPDTGGSSGDAGTTGGGAGVSSGGTAGSDGGSGGEGASAGESGSAGASGTAGTAAATSAGAAGRGGAGGNGGAVATGGAGGSGGAAPLGAPVFDGSTGYVEIPDDDVFTGPTSGALTVEAWMRPDSTAMPNVEGTGYVHWLGKGQPGQHEWVARMYQAGNSEGRENRISFYAFNLAGGLGAGSYFQDLVTAGEWIHYAGEFDASDTYIFKHGVLRDSDPLSGYAITPGNGTAPVRIGTRDLSSFFQGSIARVAFYSTRLSAAQLAAHAAETDAQVYDALVLAEPSLVAYYRLDETAGDVAADAQGGRDGRYHGGVTLAGARWRQ